MPRPHCCRRVQGHPTATIFKPAGIPAGDLTTIVMTLDEFEAIRLADREGLYQAQAAEQMGVSRATFGRIIESARRKVAEILVHGHALAIEGGPVQAGQETDCHHGWSDPVACPRCQDLAKSPSGSFPSSGPAPAGCRGRRRRCRNG